MKWTCPLDIHFVRKHPFVNQLPMKMWASCYTYSVSSGLIQFLLHRAYSKNWACCPSTITCLLVIIHVIQLNAFLYLLKSDFANEMTCYSWCDCVQTRNLPHKNIRIVFSGADNAFPTIFRYSIYVLLTESTSSCFTIPIHVDFRQSFKGSISITAQCIATQHVKWKFRKRSSNKDQVTIRYSHSLTVYLHHKVSASVNLFLLCSFFFLLATFQSIIAIL